MIQNIKTKYGTKMRLLIHIKCFYGVLVQINIKGKAPLVTKIKFSQNGHNFDKSMQ